jgi:4-amino-4-deoxy-L-arabinose transferase-like glycosyltransferase
MRLVYRWTWIVRVLVPLGALWIEGVPALIGAVLITEGGIFASRCISGRRYGLTLFAAAYALRVGLMYPSHVVAKLGNGNGALFQDDYTYDLVGEWLARIARGDGLTIFAGHQYLLYGLYDYLLMAMYVAFGHTPVLPKLLNAALAALCAVLLMEIARAAFREKRVGLVAGVAAAVLPTTVVWSIVTLKEIPILFVALVGLRALQLLADAPLRSNEAANALVALAAALALSFDLRTTICLILFSLLLLVLLVRAPFRPRRWQLGLSGLALLVLVAGGLFAFRGYVSERPPAGVLEDLALQLRHRRAQEAAAARSQIRSQTDVFTAEGQEIVLAEAVSDATPFNFATDVVDPLGYALLSPAPWQVRSLRDAAASGEMLLWYGLMVASLFAWRLAPRPTGHQRLFLVCLVLFGVGNWLVLAASEGNLGNLLRHRLMLVPPLVVLSSAGLVWLWPRLSRLRVGAPMPRSAPPIEARRETVPR